LASAGDVNEVRARIERTTRITDLVMPSGTPVPVTPAKPREAAAAEPDGDPPAGVKVPGTAWRVSQWIDTWVAMCADGTLVFGPINDDQHARTAYGVSAKHLNNVRRAAVSGALRRRAHQLGVPLPATYVDDPATNRVNGKVPATV
jgi:hypothetical protein